MHHYTVNGSCQIVQKTDSLVKENVVLRAHAQRLSYGVHFCANVSAIYVSSSRGGREQSSQYGPGVRYVRKHILCYRHNGSFIIDNYLENHRTHKVVVFPAPL